MEIILVELKGLSSRGFPLLDQSSRFKPLLPFFIDPVQFSQRLGVLVVDFKGRRSLSTVSVDDEQKLGVVNQEECLSPAHQIPLLDTRFTVIREIYNHMSFPNEASFS